ncbi:beta-glucoside-specific PTS transporter subunit IIABC [Nesterenkonia sp. CF4.4]|uniref:beta-glucoside-specific PTS transporter subunit IIABC n=1 Tax=Nesterenkonia sp. CF4.4 TaxID=3373079 RepID=UPI003EE74404
MAAVDYRSLAESIVQEMGGQGNIAAATHCATRLRLRVLDDEKVDQAAIDSLPGVLTVVHAGGQFQVVIGNDVPRVYAELSKLTGAPAGDSTDAASEDGPGQKGNLFNRFIDLVSSIFQPIIWPLAGAGLLKAFLSAANQFGWLDPESDTSVILAAAADSIFYFLPLFLAVTAARRFKANQFTSMAIAGALVYPSIVALNDTGESVSFAGIPVVMMAYTSSVIPIIVAVWLQSYLERGLDRAMPSAVRNFGTPLLSILIMVPLILMTVGPVTTFAAQGLSGGINAVFGFAPWLAGAILGGFWQVFVVFGLHWGLIPSMINDLATQGYSLLLGPLVPAVLAQAGATLAVLVRSRNAARRKVAGPAALSGFLAGVTEPAIYGVNLPLRKPFYFGIAGGVVGGAIAAAGGSAASSFVFASALALPAYTEVGSFTLLLVGTAAAVVIGFVLTFLFGTKELAAAVPAPESSEEVDDRLTRPTGGTDEVDRTAPARSAARGDRGVQTIDRADTVQVLAPVNGRIVPLESVGDKVFSSGVMGSGFAVEPSDGHVYAPISGTIQAATKSGHAIGIKSPEGVEVLLHIGIDTVALKGAGFSPVIEQGQEIRAGDLMTVVDFDSVVAAGYDPTTIVVVTNTTQLDSVEPMLEGKVSHGDFATTVRV